MVIIWILSILNLVGNLLYQPLLYVYPLTLIFSLGLVALSQLHGSEHYKIPKPVLQLINALMSGVQPQKHIRKELMKK